MSQDHGLDSLPSLGLDPERPFAVLADLHANAEAISAVARWLDEHAVDQALVLGDLIGYGASPQQTVDLVRERRWCVVRGNHEDMLLDISHVERTRALKSAARRALEWTRERLDSEAVAWFRELPPAARVGRTGLAVHGSLVDPRHCYAYIYEFSIGLNADCLRQLDPPPGTVVWFGHTHRAASYRVGRSTCIELETSVGDADLSTSDHHFVNPGSVGFPRDGDARAAFAVFDEARRGLRRVRLVYDVQTAAEKIRWGGYDESLAARLLAAR